MIDSLSTGATLDKAVILNSEGFFLSYVSVYQSVLCAFLRLGGGGGGRKGGRGMDQFLHPSSPLPPSLISHPPYANPLGSYFLSLYQFPIFVPFLFCFQSFLLPNSRSLLLNGNISHDI